MEYLKENKIRKLALKEIAKNILTGQRIDYKKIEALKELEGKGHVTLNCKSLNRSPEPQN